MSKDKYVSNAKQQAKIKLMLANDSICELVIPHIKKLRSSKYEANRDQADVLEVALVSINTALESLNKAVDLLDAESGALAWVNTEQNELICDSIKTIDDFEKYLNKLVRPYLIKIGGAQS